jgi:hypothetical protein
MNHSFFSKLGGVSIALFASVVFLNLSASAQTDYFFDPSGSAAGTGSGGSGTWDTAATQDWFLPGTGDTGFPAAAAGNANFDGAGGTVSVVGSVDPAAINFDSTTGDYTVNAGAAGSIDLGAANNFTVSNAGSNAVAINAPITFSGGSGSISLNLSNTSTGNIIFGSTVTNADTSGTPQFFQVNATAGTTEFNGNILGANSGSDPNSGSPTNDNITVAGGATVLADNGNFDRFQVTGGSLLTHGAVNVTATNAFTSNNGTIGGATADVSTFSGSIANFGGTQTLAAAAGGQVNFTGDLFAGGTGSSREIISGPGIINFAVSNDYASQYQTPGNNTAVGTEINTGATLLITNTSGSATGAGTNQATTNGAGGGSNNVVQLDAGGTLAGTGITQQNVVAMGATSVLSPGGMSQAKVSSIGTLHLDNGLTATSGLTVKFDLNGTGPSDLIEISSATLGNEFDNPAAGAAVTPLILSGNITFDFTNLGGALTNSEYTLFTSASGTPWDLSGANFIFDGPAGYTVNDLGVVDNGTTENFEVNFTAAPEPSTWALIGLGALVLVGSGKLRKFRV